MALDAALLDLLACPGDDHAPLIVQQRDGADVLVCSACLSAFRIEDGIPVLLVDEAVPGPKGVGVPADPADIEAAALVPAPRRPAPRPANPLLPPNRGPVARPSGGPPVAAPAGPDPASPGTSGSAGSGPAPDVQDTAPDGEAPAGAGEADAPDADRRPVDADDPATPAPDERPSRRAAPTPAGRAAGSAPAVRLAREQVEQRSAQLRRLIGDRGRHHKHNKHSR